MTQALATAPVTATAATTQKNAFSADRDMFLKLLTTQMQNQDPLDPMDSTEYTQQLVQYSQVEQSIQQTGVMQDVLAQLKSQNMLQASGLIGRVVDIKGAEAGLGSGPALWSYSFDATPAQVEATIRNDAGEIVHRFAPGATAAGNITWDGKRADGQVAPPGSYTLEIAATSASGSALPATIGSYGIVEQVVSDTDGTMLRINGRLVALRDVTSVGQN